MKNVVNNFGKNLKNYSVYLGIFFMTLGLTSCSNDDDGVTPDPDPEPTGTITANNQTLSQNTLILDNVTVGQDSWLVVRNAGEDDMVADPVFVEEGSNQNVEIQLNTDANLTGDAEGDDFDVFLFADNQNQGTQGSFDVGTDAPITDASGARVSQTVNLTAPSLFADDNQTMTDNREVTFNSVTSANDGWITLFGQDDEGNMDESTIIGTGFVEAGTHENFTVQFNDDYNHVSGNTIFSRLNMDDPADQEFTFVEGGDEDLPETFGFDTTTGDARFVGNTSTTTGGFVVN